MNIIGINGFKRSGKGETGKAIEELLIGVHQLGFADKLKVYAARSLGFMLSDADCIALMDIAKEEWVTDIKRKAKHPEASAIEPGLEPIKRWTVRKLLQYMGTEARHVFGENFWADQVLPTVPPHAHPYEQLQHELHAMYPNSHILVFTDLRFQNEAQRIKDLGGINFEVIRPGAASDGHASEQALPRHLIDYQIPNHGSLGDLKWEVNKALELAGLMP